MKKAADKLIEAQEYAMSIKPKIGGFPILAEVLRQAGVLLNRWHLPSCQSVYIMKDGNVLQQGTPLVTGTYEVPVFNKEALIEALRTDQAGNSTFLEFLQATWAAGVICYEVDFTTHKVTYHGVGGESYIEGYPAIEVKRH